MSYVQFLYVVVWFVISVHENHSSWHTMPFLYLTSVTCIYMRIESELKVYTPPLHCKWSCFGSGHVIEGLAAVQRVIFNLGYVHT